jgi:CxxC-x17-CxxC domain-containing protein
MDFLSRDKKKYNRSEDSGRGRSSGSDFSRSTVLTKVTCDSCGQSCQIPFKPSSGRPVYCDSCFKKENSRSHDSFRKERPSNRSNDRFGQSENRSFSPRSSGVDLSEINRKLDKILELLED